MELKIAKVDLSTYPSSCLILSFHKTILVFIGAVCLQCMVLAALLRPISYYETIYATELRELCTPDSSGETTSEMCGEKSERNSEIKPCLNSDLDPSTTKKDESLITVSILSRSFETKKLLHQESHRHICFSF